MATFQGSMVKEVGATLGQMYQIEKRVINRHFSQHFFLIDNIVQINSDASEKSLRGNQVKVNNVYEARISEEVAQSDYSKINSYV